MVTLCNLFSLAALNFFFSLDFLQLYSDLFQCGFIFIYLVWSSRGPLEALAGCFALVCDVPHRQRGATNGFWTGNWCDYIVANNTSGNNSYHPSCTGHHAKHSISQTFVLSVVRRKELRRLVTRKVTMARWQGRGWGPGLSGSSHRGKATGHMRQFTLK